MYIKVSQSTCPAQTSRYNPLLDIYVGHISPELSPTSPPPLVMQRKKNVPHEELWGSYTRLGREACKVYLFAIQTETRVIVTFPTQLLINSLFPQHVPSGVSYIHISKPICKTPFFPPRLTRIPSQKVELGAKKKTFSRGENGGEGGGYGAAP